MEKKILVYGAGTIGTYLGTKLKDAGFDVILHGRKRLNAMNEIIHINDEPETHLPKKSENITDEHFDILFVTTKLYDLSEVLKEIKDNNITYDIIVFIQNGIISDEILKDIEKKKIVLVSISEGYSISGNDKIVAQKNNQGWHIDTNIGGPTIKGVLDKAGILGKIDTDFSRVKAEKMIVNCSVSALSVIDDKTISELLENPTDRARVIDLIDETYNVLSMKYLMPVLEEVREKVLKLLASNGAHYPSLYQDFKRNKKTEIDYFNGQIVKWAKEENIPVPVSELVLKEYKDRE